MYLGNTLRIKTTAGARNGEKIVSKRVGGNLLCRDKTIFSFVQNEFIGGDGGTAIARNRGFGAIKVLELQIENMRKKSFISCSSEAPVISENQQRLDTGRNRRGRARKQTGEVNARVSLLSE